MQEDFSHSAYSPASRSGSRQRAIVSPSREKALRTALLAMLLQVSWPRRLTKQAIVEYLPYYGESARQRGLYRDIETLTDSQVDELPGPNDENVAEWCVNQRHRRLLAITYDRHDNTFGLAESFFTMDISEDEARAFVTLQDGFAPGTPYAEAVRRLLERWEWMFSERSRQLVRQKRRRHAKPVLLPLSPVVDYSQHEQIILLLDQALEEGAYVSFAYTPLAQNWDADPVRHEHVEPYELEYRDGHWYFTAYVFDLNTFLDYRVDRIHPGSLKKEPDRFRPGSRTRRGVKVRYWVSPMLARHGSLSARLQEQHVTLLDNDQGAIVEGYAKSVWWARRLLLGYGEQVKALAPESLVAAMREAAQMMGTMYKEEQV